jgi:phage terminase large subunit-like protein
MRTFSVESLASLTLSEREELIRSLTAEEADRLAFEWRFWARPSQAAPDGDWRFWLLLAGRGFGKTRAAGEWIRERVDAGARHLILAGAIASDVRDIMVEGESGILAISPPWNRPKYEPSKARLTWPSGARALLLSADEPDRFRGKQCDTFWADELAAWRYPEAWDQMVLGFRLGAAYGITPRGIVSTTPRPTHTIRELIKHERSVVTGGSTYDNIANLAPAFVEEIRSKYEGTRLGRQELHAEVLEDVADALWSYDSIARARLEAATPERLPTSLSSIAVAVDPSGCAGPDDKRSDEVGIVVVGVDNEGALYILEDASGRYGPAGPRGWGAKVVALYHKWRADSVVGEVNFGGAMVASVVLTADPNVPFREVTASRAKHVRAEPVSVLFERAKAFLCGFFPELEEQLVQFSTAGYMGRKSPDRADAMVWGAHALGVTRMPGQGLLTWMAEEAAKASAPKAATASPEVANLEYVELLAPPHIAPNSTFYSREGAVYQVEAGRVRAKAADVEDLCSSGFYPPPIDAHAAYRSQVERLRAKRSP